MKSLKTISSIRSSQPQQPKTFSKSISILNLRKNISKDHEKSQIKKSSSQSQLSLRKQYKNQQKTFRPFVNERRLGKLIKNDNIPDNQTLKQYKSASESKISYPYQSSLKWYQQESINPIPQEINKKNIKRIYNKSIKEAHNHYSTLTRSNYLSIKLLTNKICFRTSNKKDGKNCKYMLENQLAEKTYKLKIPPQFYSIKTKLRNNSKKKQEQNRQKMKICASKMDQFIFKKINIQAPPNGIANQQTIELFESYSRVWEINQNARRGSLIGRIF